MAAGGAAAPAEGLEARLAELSRRKAHLELLNRMLTRLTEVTGLENMVEHILGTLLETIGAGNIALYHLVDDRLHYADIYGERKEIGALEDERVRRVLESRTPLRTTTNCNEVLPAGPTGLGLTETWLFPLLARDRPVGVVVMEDMQLLQDGIWHELQPFFTYAGLMLDNEISNYSQLAETHRRLQESETLYRTLFEQSPDGIQLTDPVTTRPVHFNTAMHRQLGYTREEFAGLAVADYEALDRPEDISGRVDALLRTGSAAFESVYRTKGGERLHVLVALCAVDVSGRPLILAIVWDITERKRLEADRLDMERRLLHSQKLESLGVLTGGIAHDFNNLLTAIMGNLELSRPGLPAGSPDRERLDNALTACERAADLIRQMLAYSGKGTFEKQPVDLSALVQKNADLLRTSIPRSISLDIGAAEGLPPILADPGQVQQVVMNLITNAAEAIGPGAGRISVRTGSAECADADLAGSLLEEKPPPGRYVWVEVADDGCGMGEETKKRLFEPFFTTKFTGRGLGMSAVLGILGSHRGALFLESEVGRGSRFRVLFPAQPMRPQAPVLARPKAAPGEHALVLVADDDEMVREFCCACLENLGCRVLAAADGVEALELFRGHADEIRLVILDLTMPRMDGVAAFRELKALRPDVKVLVSSGYGEQGAASQFPDRKPEAFLQKPFALKTLQETVRRVLA